MIVFISGPMTGHPNYNWPSFDIAAVRLTWLGHTPINPAQIDRDLGLKPSDMGEALSRVDQGLAMLRCATVICMEAEAIYLLNGWTASKGARAEYRLAIALGLEILYESVGCSTSDEVTKEII